MPSKRGAGARCAGRLMDFHGNWKLNVAIFDISNHFRGPQFLSSKISLGHWHHCAGDHLPFMALECYKLVEPFAGKLTDGLAPSSCRC